MISKMQITEHRNGAHETISFDSYIPKTTRVEFGR